MDATPPPKTNATGAGVAAQDHEQPGYRRTPPASGRTHAGARGGKDYDLRVSILPTVHGEKDRAARAG